VVNRQATAINAATQEAVMSGSKTIRNTTPFSLNVTIIGRKGDSPSNDGESVSATIAPNQSATLQYGNNQNPYMNALEFSLSGQGMKDSASLRATERGGAGTLDAFFNTHSVITIGYAQQSFSFPLQASN